MFNYYVGYPMIKRMKPFHPLNLEKYDKAAALTELSERTGWRAYPRKHGESVFTKFFQNYYLPTRFGYDKRLPHLSSLIASGQMTRADALAALEEPLFEAKELERDMEYVCRKLNVSRAEFDDLMAVPKRSHEDFANWSGRYKALKLGQRTLRRVTGRRVGVYE
jgi:hypothetical protein